MLTQTLYDQDFHQWIEKTINQLEQRDFNNLDINHLIEELQDLGKSDKNALESNLVILLAHLLKLKIQADIPDTMKASWYRSVIEHRERLLMQLENIPSLKSYLPTILNTSYSKDRKIAIKESKLPTFGIAIPDEKDYPLACPFSLEQILNEDYYG
jgi:hypothetical protein